jgi:molybdenum cofactor cytidylyltransferase
MVSSLFNQLTPLPEDGVKSKSLPTSQSKAIGVLLAAGRGARFDPTGNTSKLLQKIDGIPIVCHAAAHLRAACTEVIAIVRPGSSELKLWLRQAGCIVVECPDAHSGMGHSLAWGIAEADRLYNPDIVVVALGDMPFVRPATITQLTSAISPEVQAASPEFMGRRGNPVAFGRSLFEKLGECRGDRGAAAVLEEDQLHLVSVADPGVLRDIDSPEDLTVQD